VKTSELPSEQVIAWLRSPGGQHVTGDGELLVPHDNDSGWLAEVLPDGSPDSAASWPDPFYGDGIDDDRQQPPVRLGHIHSEVQICLPVCPGYRVRV
jgi:hypothetical protein